MSDCLQGSELLRNINHIFVFLPISFQARYQKSTGLRTSLNKFTRKSSFPDDSFCKALTAFCPTTRSHIFSIFTSFFLKICLLAWHFPEGLCGGRQEEESCSELIYASYLFPPLSSHITQGQESFLIKSWDRIYKTEVCLSCLV